MEVLQDLLYIKQNQGMCGGLDIHMVKKDIIPQ